MILVRHDLPIADALRERRPDLSVHAAADAADVRETLPDADVLIVNPTYWEDAFVEGLDRGDWVQTTSAGYAAYPVEAFEREGIALTNASGNYDQPVSEHAFALALSLSRGVPAFVDAQRAGEWRRERGSSLTDWAGRTATVVGLGNIGDAVAERALAFEMTVRGTKRDPDDYAGCLPRERVHPPEDLGGLLPDTDLLVLTCPLTGDTRGLVDADALAALPETAVLVNVARGPVVEEDALVAALEAGEIAGAGLDVFEEEPLPEGSPLWDREDVVITPHVGGRSDAFVERFVDLFLANHDRREAGEALENRVA